MTVIQFIFCKLFKNLPKIDAVYTFHARIQNFTFLSIGIVSRFSLSELSVALTTKRETCVEVSK